METIEKEIKYLLGEDDFNLLFKYLESKYLKSNVITQVNYYVDTEDMLLESKRITARIRVIDSNLCEFTIKRSLKAVKDNLHIKEESTSEIEKEVADKLIVGEFIDSYKDLLNPVFSQIGEIENISKLKIWGNLATERTSFIINSKLPPLLLDRSIYLGSKDYEIEWEGENISAFSQILSDILSELKISPINSSDSKNARFLKRFKEDWKSPQD